jgi:hypothetical protein
MLKKAYQAASGVRSVNGEAVPDDGVVHLTQTEALYDLAHGNVVEIPSVDPVLVETDPPSPRRRPTK